MYTTADGPTYHWRTTASWAFLSSVTAFPLAPGYCWGTPAESREWEGRGERGLEHVQRQEIRENTCTREHIHTHTHTHTHTHARTHTHTPQPAQPASGVALPLPARASRHGRPRSANAHTFGCVEHAEHNVPNQSAMFSGNGTALKGLASCLSRRRRLTASAEQSFQGRQTPSRTTNDPRSPEGPNSGRVVVPFAHSR